MQTVKAGGRGATDQHAVTTGQNLREGWTLCDRYIHKINDTSICIPASILVYQKEKAGQKLCEFDGMIIHPMRKKKQIVFLEAKNTKVNPSRGKNVSK